VRDTVQSSVTIAAAPDKVWGMVSDVTRMSEWSPETTRNKWLGGAAGPMIGARFRGVNRHGPFMWATTCTVVAADPGREFTFRVTSLGMQVSEWSYKLAPSADGCELTESTTDRRGWFMRTFGATATGVFNRPDHNLEGIKQTLESIKAKAESA
jgi:uncharacterized protein YndB with AHSA1/START domain